MSTRTEDAYAWRAIDGDVSDHKHPLDRCAHTAKTDQEQWWSVDLRRKYFIDFVRVVTTKGKHRRFLANANLTNTFTTNSDTNYFQILKFNLSGRTPRQCTHDMKLGGPADVHNVESRSYRDFYRNVFYIFKLPYNGPLFQMT